MKVAKWGNSLAVRLPAELVQKLGLKEGDEVELAPCPTGGLELSLDERRQKALERMRELSIPLPPGYKFDREEANARGPYPDLETGKPEAAAD